MAPLRVLKAKGSHYIRKVMDHAVRLINKEKGDEILAGTTKDAYRQTLNVVDEKSSRRMKEIHEKFRAPLYGSSPPAPPSHHHESGPAATPYGLATKYPAPSQHHATGRPVPPYAQGPLVPMAPPHYHQSVHPAHAFLPSYPPPAWRLDCIRQRTTKRFRGTTVFCAGCSLSCCHTCPCFFSRL